MSFLKNDSITSAGFFLVSLEKKAVYFALLTFIFKKQ